MNKITQYLVSAVLLLVIDAIYLHSIKVPFASMVVSIQRVVMKVKMIPAIICYLLLTIGLNYFILDQGKTVMEAFLFGLVIYGVFDSTNMAIFKKYDWKLAMIDSLWGGVLMALTTSIIYML
jgi:uncharacterized membrane protein